jgi:hypothetical protein
MQSHPLSRSFPKSSLPQEGPTSRSDPLPRSATLATRIKKRPGYTEAIGQNRSIVGSEKVRNFDSLKPVLKLTFQAGHPNED